MITVMEEQCADLNCVDKNKRNGYVGTLNVRPLSEEVVQAFVQYMRYVYFIGRQKEDIGNILCGDR